MMPGYYAGEEEDEGLLVPPGSKPYEDDDSEDEATILESSERTRYEPLRLKIVCTPAQHRSGRGLFDQMKTLWASWVVGIVDEAADAEEEGFTEGAFKVFFGG
jgi:L-ascorbate metabolism protein UlaG (beta-lactamase superfamily)